MRLPIKPQRPIINRSHPLSKGLIGAWPIFEHGGTSATDLKDISGFNNNVGTLGSITYERSHLGQAAVLNANTDDLTVGEGAGTTLQPTKGISMAVWLKTTDQAVGDPYLIGFTGTADSYAIFLNGDGSDTVVVAINAVNKAQSLSIISNGKIHQVVGTFDGANVKCYFDRALEATTAFAGDIVYNLIGFGLGLASNPGYSSAGSKGSFYDFRLYNRALSASEVNQSFFDPWALYTKNPSMLDDFSLEVAGEDGFNPRIPGYGIIPGGGSGYACIKRLTGSFY